MKIRMGFVSNSSSSSFIAIVTRNPLVISGIEKYLGIEEGGENYSLYDFSEEHVWSDSENKKEIQKRNKDKKLTDADYDRYQIKGTELILFESEGQIHMVGINVDGLLTVEQFTVERCEDRLIEQLKELGIDLEKTKLQGKQARKQIYLEYGDWGSG